MTIIRYDEITHSSLWWSHHVLLIEIRNVYFAISSLYYQSSPIVGTSSAFSISLSATTFHFFTHFKMICTKFPGPSCYFSVYEFNEYDRGNYEICFYIRAGIFGTSLKQLYFAAIPYLPTRDERGSPQWGKPRLVVALQVIYYRLILCPGPATLSEAQGLVLVYSSYLSDLPNPWRLPAKPNHCKTS